MNNKIKELVETSLFIALAVIFGLLFKLTPKLPNGGRISLASLPIMIAGFKNGIKHGVFAGLCYGLINFLLDGMVLHLGSIIFDYLIPFCALGLTGIFKEKSKNIKWYVFAMLFSLFIRYLSHSFSGVLFFKEYIPSQYNTTLLMIFYSFILYNGTYMLGTAILCILVALPLHKLVYKDLKK